ncbi:hypothetical protein CAEBREN_23511 [Caenorhabditis brenneri]|uniref:PAN-3 domain-containing protein n=1 Tax=Caenorhabditis brenneri TaxID=135651 RepID=G0NVM5_CAEBE|nr:hypothetical protein CAEBREN_23511 [Caenorhabditis brenneri]
MPRFLLFSLLFLPFSYGKQWKMMLIHGDVLGASEFPIEKMNRPMEECHALCYNTNECARLLQDDQCPDLSNNNYTSIDMWRGANNSAVMLNKISKSGFQWSITYNYLACDIRTQLFRRENYWVCVGARAFFDGCGSYNAAEDLCNGVGISLTGPYSNEEEQFLYESRGSYPGYNTLLWVDGRNEVYKDPTVNNGKNYPMCGPSDRTLCHYIDTGNCVNTFDCFKSVNNNDCWHGAACLMKYFKIY